MPENWERLFYWAPLVHCERSLFFLLTCDLYCCGASRSGRADSWGNCGRADGQLGQFEEREREEERERYIEKEIERGEREESEGMRETDVRGKGECACVWGGG